MLLNVQPLEGMGVYFKGFLCHFMDEICTGQANDLVHVAREPNTTEGFTNWLQLGLSQQVCLCDPTKVSMGHEGTEVVKAESPIIIFLIGHNYY